MMKKEKKIPREEGSLEEAQGNAQDAPIPGEGESPAVGGVDRSPANPEEDVPEEPEGEGGPEEQLGRDFLALQEEMDRLRDQHLRLAADFENYRKRVNAELSGVWVRAQAELVRSLVDVLDDLQRVSQFTSENASLETLIEGVDLVERKLLKALVDAGLEALIPEGEPFDPNLMEAVMRVSAGEEGQDDMVHQVFQRGYRFKDQLVRPARVSVFKDDD